MTVRHQETDDEAEPVQEQIISGPREPGDRGDDRGGLPPARDQRADLLSVEAKYGGMGPSDAQRMKTLEDENRRLKKLLAESMLDLGGPEGSFGKKTELACGRGVRRHNA